MTEERRVAERRRFVRRTQAEPGKALVVLQPSEPADASEPPRNRRGGAAAFAAQLLGQGGQKRGLRAGQPALDQARSTYLETEWSGPADRRPNPGRITKTEI